MVVGLLINESVNIPQTKKCVERKLEDIVDQYFSALKTDTNSYQITADTAFGTMTIRGGGNIGIKVRATLKQIDQNTTTVKLYTRLRPELTCILLFASIIVCTQIFGNDKIPLWIDFIFPVMLLFFWNIYRKQETRLTADVIYYLTN